jgi:hypothetical protein
MAGELNQSDVKGAKGILKIVEIVSMSDTLQTTALNLTTFHMHYIPHNSAGSIECGNARLLSSPFIV